MALAERVLRERVHGDLPAGVVVTDLPNHPDDRGVFRELFRDEWSLPVDPVQWNMARSRPNVLRGAHVHHRHDDYLTVVSGTMAVGLHDLRPVGGTTGAAAVIELDGDEGVGVVIPRGVVHAFWSRSPSVHVYAVSHEWDPGDELGCRWDDPALAIPWPFDDREPLLSARDRGLSALADLAARLSTLW